jgi:hypothetical protein
MRLTVMSLLVLLVSACGLSPKPDVTATPPDKPRLDRPDSTSMRECTWPMVVKLGRLTRQQVEELLRSNAYNQIDCLKRHHNLIVFVDDRDGGLTGTPTSPAK